MCKNCFISALATYFSIYFLLAAITEPLWSIWTYSLIITILVFIAVLSCPLNKEGWRCCVGKVKKKK